MTTKLEKPLRRAVMIGREPYVVTITPSGLKLTKKGRRKGVELDWKGLASGDAALAAALNASVRESSRRGPAGTSGPTSRRREASRDERATRPDRSARARRVR
jgi:hypothetical protein